MNSYCTLFDVNYLTKGLAMISSLQAKDSEGAQVYVLAMDEASEKILKELAWKDVTVISLREFENQDLLGVKPGRNAAEYCWTCTPAIIRYMLDTFKVSECTYVDADLYFFNDPVVLLTEVREAGKSVLVTPHNYSLFFDQTKNSGAYCVQFMYFKNDSDGRKVLECWYRQCIEWCFARVENGKFGDQKYLDAWPTDFPEAVHSLVHLGALAPWNVNNYKVKVENDLLCGISKTKKFPVVFYHFHGLHLLPNNLFTFGWYPLSKEVRKVVYASYAEKLQSLERLVQGQFLALYKPRTKAEEFNILKMVRRFMFERFFYFSSRGQRNV